LIRRRELLVTNILGLAVLLVVLLMGWWDAAAFGLVVLVVLDLLVVLRGRQARTSSLADHAEGTKQKRDLPARWPADSIEEERGE
jgi:hypothetical protein